MVGEFGKENSGDSKMAMQTSEKYTIFSVQGERMYFVEK